jgi:glutamine cyclotransferase
MRRFGVELVVTLVLFASVAAAAPTVEPVILQRYPHDPNAFTQGLVLRHGELFESTGLYTRSSLRKVELRTGAVLESVSLPDLEFGEGLAVVGDRLIQLTWQNGLAHVYSIDGFEDRGRFSYDGEGWGLCHDGARLVMSDGSDRLYFRDPDTFELLGSVAVQDEGEPVFQLNELECVGSEVYANVWLTNFIVRIDPESGDVLTRVDASALLAADPAPGANVLNGIAFDPQTGHFLLTGKLWPGLFEVSIPVPEAAASPAASGGKSSGCWRNAGRERQPATAALAGGLILPALLAWRASVRLRSSRRSRRE